ncbi:VPDSG-CTERM sorting domain-containing protein [Candidatus Pelagisphaera phototrophica]
MNYDRDDPSEYFGSFLVRANSVPDTGSTAALLGLGVVALAFARCKLG